MAPSRQVKRATARKKAKASDDGRKFAGKQALGNDLDYEEKQLQHLLDPETGEGMWVRIRKLDTPEIAALSYIPDLAGFSEIADKLKGMKNVDVAKMAEVDPKFALNNFNYMAAVAHTAVMDIDAGDEDRDCQSCGQRHPPSLWTMKQCRKLRPQDMSLITRVAMGQEVVDSVVPFSEAPTPSDTPSPADTGSESIPQTS